MGEKLAKNGKLPLFAYVSPIVWISGSFYSVAGQRGRNRSFCEMNAVRNTGLAKDRLESTQEEVLNLSGRATSHWCSRATSAIRTLHGAQAPCQVAFTSYCFGCSRFCLQLSGKAFSPKRGARFRGKWGLGPPPLHPRPLAPAPPPLSPGRRWGFY